MVNSDEPFAQIWHWNPQDLTRFSSLWWFFLLFPRQNGHFGPKQMMFTLVSRVGQDVQINKVRHSGIEHPRATGSLEDPFPGMALAWLYDGEQMHEGLVQHPATIQVSAGQSIQGWDERGYGGSIIATNGRPFATDVAFRGERGSGQFAVWGDPASEISSPIVFKRNSVIGDVNAVAWRHLSFSGEFVTPTGSETLDGVGFFQRVCLNILPFPWKWILTRFADGSVFSCFIPYMGAHLLRRGDWFFPEWLESLTLPVQGSAYFSRGEEGSTVTFSQVRAKPLLGQGKYPHFQVIARADNGDFLNFRVTPYTHAQVLLERSLFGPFSSCYNYNEYLFQCQDVTGSMAGEPLNSATLGPGYGNFEYTWGLGI